MSSDPTESILWKKGYRVNSRNEWYLPHKDNRELQATIPQPAVRNDVAATPPGKARVPYRIVVRITSFRNRLLDPDNLCPKFLIDGLRYACLIPQDREQDIVLEIKQVKSNEERTEVVLLRED